MTQKLHMEHRNMSRNMDHKNLTWNTEISHDTGGGKIVHYTGASDFWPNVYVHIVHICRFLGNVYTFVNFWGYLYTKRSILSF